MEMEESGKLPYLDIELHRQNNGRILTKWYSKPMASNRLLNYNSNHTLQQKINVASGLIKRVCELTTTNPKIENLPRITELLKRNNYPVPFIKKLFYKYLNHQQNGFMGDKKSTQNNNVQIKYKSISNVNGLTAKLSKCFKNVTNSLKICPKNIKTAKNLYTKVKDKTEKGKLSNLVYAIPCLDCQKSYIGMTHRQYLQKRLKQHFGDIECLHKLRNKVKIDKVFDIKEEIEEKLKHENNKKSGKNTENITNLKKLQKQCEKSGLVTHHIELGHRLDFKNTKIIDKEENKKKLEILEILHIKTNENFNKKEEINKMKSTYDGILLKIKKKNSKRI
jgi:hypothetical protein